MQFPEFNPKEGQDTGTRLQILAILFCIGFVVLFLRLWYLHVIKGETYRLRAENNRVRIVSVKPPRGLIYDRRGEPLADRHSSFNLTLTIEDVHDIKRVAAELERYMKIPAEETLAKVTESKRRKPFEPVTIRENLSFEEVAMAEAHQYELEGLSVSVDVARSYPHGDTASHLLGYLGKITQDQMEEERYGTFPSDTLVGQNGVEKTLDDILRGRPGTRLIEVNVIGREVRTLQTQEPEAGRDTFLTIDLNVQQAAERALGSRAGAVVAIDPTTGEVLAFVSKPAFDPNIFIYGIPTDTWNSLNKNPDHPFQNRVAQSSYPPGSVFKIVTAIAGLETGTITPDATIHCSGSYPFGKRSFGCWKRSGHGTVNLHRALVESCDVYFYDLGRRLGIDTVAKYARALGLGQQTNIEIPSEKSGLIPDREWKQRVRKEQWYQGETLSASIGQGYVLTTPLQVASFMAAVANDGKKVQPTIIKSVRRGGGKDFDAFPPAYYGNASISPETLRIIRSALMGVVHEPGGTAGSARSPLATIAGKTGTAQVISLGKGGGGKRFQDHAWFAAFSPVDAPRIAVAVMVEHGGHGGSAAAPIAKEVIEAFLRGPTTQKTPPTAPTDTAPAAPTEPLATPTDNTPTRPAEENELDSGPGGRDA